MNAVTRCCLLLLVAACSPLPLKAGPPDHADIRQVIESFRTAIIARDKPRFLALFLQDHVNWQAVVGDDSLSHAKLRNPEAVKARIDSADSHIAFAESFAKDQKRNEEVFSGIRIDSDGDAASVSFDYVYLYDGQETNRGKEYWLLVRTETGWKITSLVYSVNLPPSATAAGS